MEARIGNGDLGFQVLGMETKAETTVSVGVFRRLYGRYSGISVVLQYLFTQKNSEFQETVFRIFFFRDGNLCAILFQVPRHPSTPNPKP